MRLELLRQAGEVRLPRRRLGVHHQVERRQIGSPFPSTVDLSDSAPDTIACYRPPHLAAHGHPEPRPSQPVGHHEHHEKATVASVPLAITALIVRTAPKPLSQGQGLNWTRRISPPWHEPLGGKPRSALRPPTSQDRAALPRLHACPKAVLLLTAAVVGLKSTFHGSRPSKTSEVVSSSPASKCWLRRCSAHDALELVNLAEDRVRGQAPGSSPSARSTV